MTNAEELIAAARAARENAYANFSKFRVGAAIEAADGRIFAGCNVENASYGLTICAERVAVCTAVASGCRKFVRLALSIDDGGTPCGACRQVLAEFCADDLIVLIDDAKQQGVVRETTLGTLFPDGFRFKLK